MNFTDIIGQTSVKKYIITAIDEGRIPHALLFLGETGSGSLPLVLATAQYLICSNKESGKACGTCANCNKAAKHIHPDIHFSFPTVGTNVKSDSLLPEWREAILQNPYLSNNNWLTHINAENRQGNINKDECLNIIRKMSLKPYEATYKVSIIWMAEFLGKEGNRLLKLIEEPAENTVFLLIAENQELLLNTILPRCQLVKVPRITDTDMINALQQKHQLSVDKANATAILAQGNYRSALELMDEKESEYAELFLTWLRTCYKGSSRAMVKFSEDLATIGRERQKFFMRYGLHFLREYMIMSSTGAMQVRLSEQEKTAAQKLKAIIGFDQISALTDLFNDCYYYIERNGNAKIIFLDASVQINQILKSNVLV